MLACFALPGMAPVLVPLRLSSEALLIPHTSIKGVAKAALDCARPADAVYLVYLVYLVGRT